MMKSTTWMASLLTVVVVSANAWAQTVAPPESVAANGPAVTISVTEGGVRFVGLGSLRQMRLEVFSGDGQTIYNSEFHNGNVRDWTLQDKAGQRVADGTYLCVITIRDLSGKLVTKQGSVLLQNGQASLQMDGAAAGNVEPEKALTPVDGTTAAVTVVGHDGSNGQVVSTQGSLTFRLGDLFAGQDKEFMRLTPEGNLGVGVKTPEVKLDVAGMVRAQQGFMFNDGSTLNVNEKGALILTASDGTVAPNTAGTGTQNHLAKWLETGGAGTLGDSSVTELANGFVGIGTVSPTVRLDVVDDTSGVGGFQLTNHTNGSTAQLQNRLANNTGAFAYYGITSTSYTQAPILSNRAFFGSFQVDTVIWTQTANDILFATNGLSTATERMRIKSSGNVGIGTNNPQSLLDVAGNLNVSGNATISGNIAAKYQDIAEWTAARGEAPAGTVVSLDVERTNSVRASQRAYDTRVAGVVSAKPGVILGEDGPNKALVATTGRVKVRVNAERAPIQIGDLLVTSNIPGVAMKSQPLRVHGRLLHRPGTIIGKALEPLAKGQAEILVLLSLQ